MGADGGWFRGALWLLGALLAALLGVAGALVAAPVAAPLLRVEAPRSRQAVGLEGLEILVRFDPRGRAEPATFRALLNGADVTDRLQTAGNGAHGRLHELLDGENVLRLEVFGRRPWLGRVWLEERREIRVLFRRPIRSDQA